MSNTLTLTNAGINSGSPVTLLSSKLSYSWTNITADFPIPGQYQTIQPVQYKGWQNPVYTIIFAIELTNPASGCITWTQFMNIVQDATNKTYLGLTFGIGNTIFTSYASSSSVGTSSIPIQVKDFQIVFDPNIIDKMWITMNCEETV